MKPSLLVQSVPNVSSTFSSHYNFIERLNIVTDCYDFEPKVLISDFTFFRFSSTLNKFFTLDFISTFVASPFLLKSIEALNEITGISLTIDLETNLVLTLSKSLDQSTGLDASKPLVDSALFDSSTRLLKFNLKELAEQKNRLDRIKINSTLLQRKEYSCNFVAVIETSKYSQLQELFTKLGIDLIIQEPPRITQMSLESILWPVKDEFHLQDQIEILNLFDWIGSSLRPQTKSSIKEDDEFFFTAKNCNYFSIEGHLLPPTFQPLLNHLATSSTRLIFSLKVCQRIPPPFDLNSKRLKHFNEKKFDSSACTADQMALIVFKSPSQTISFKLNTAV